MWWCDGVNQDGPVWEVVPGVALSSDFISGFCGVGRVQVERLCLTHGSLKVERAYGFK